MYWGAGPELGLLTFIGYVFFAMGAAIVWLSRADLSIWAEDELSAFRRNLSRHTAVGPFYSLREESRLKLIPSEFFRSLHRLPRRRIPPAVILLLIGLLLLLLDFFI